jgi:hypothetical protein
VDEKAGTAFGDGTIILAPVELLEAAPVIRGACCSVAAGRVTIGAATGRTVAVEAALVLPA